MMFIKVYLRNVISTFFVFLCFQILFSMALKSKNGSLSGYDIILCTMTYAGATLFFLIPYFFIRRMRDDMNYGKIVRFVCVENIWIEGCKNAFVWALDMTISIFISGWLSFCFIADALCDWENKESIFYRYTKYELSVIPKIQEVLLPACALLFLNILFIVLITYLFYWYTGFYWFGYGMVLVLYLLPEIQGGSFQFSGLGLYYLDYCDNIDVGGICRRGVILAFLCVVTTFLGYIRKRKDFFC